VVLCGDGCLQEGVANEAVAFAGHEKLDHCARIA
jgi:transketolase